MNKITGSYIPIEYQQNSTYYNNYAFKERAANVLKASYFITPLYETCSTAINLYTQAVLKAKNYDTNSKYWPENEYIRLSIPDIEYNSACGVITMTINNFAKRPMFFLEIENNNFIQLNPPIGETKSYNPHPFVNYIPEECENTKEVKILKINEVETWISIALCIISIIISMVCLIFTIKYREKKIIKCCSSLYYYCLLFSLVVAAGSVITLTLTPDESSTLCYIRINLCLFAVVSVSSMLLSKAVKYSFSKRKRIHKVLLLFILFY